MTQNPQQLEVKYGLPREVVYCKRCVISNQRPMTTLETKHDKSQPKPTMSFDEDGVCAACRWAEIKESQIDWAAREQELYALADRFRSKEGSYDVIVPSSGGKDSGYVAHILKHKYGLNPLTVTWAPHMYTDIGWKNFQALIHAGFDNVLFTPNGKTHRLLTRLAFLNLGHPFQPFIWGQRNLAPLYAMKYGVRLIFYGENVAEYSNKIEDNYNPQMDRRYYTSLNIDDPETMISGVSIGELKERYGVTRHDLLPYGSPTVEQVEAHGLEFHYMSYYRKWVPQDNYYYAVENCGFQPNPERTQGSYSRYSGIDDRMEYIHYYCMLAKFGMGRAIWDAAQEVRSGKIDRDEGVALVRKYDGEFPSKYFQDFLEYCEIDEATFHETVDALRSPHLWTKEGGEWKLRHPVE